MKKVFAKCLIATVCAVMLAGSASAQRLHGVSGGPAESGWFVYTYNNVSPNPLWEPVTATKGGGVSFNFYNTPDRALLINNVTNNNQFKPGTLTGKSLSARIAISATGPSPVTFNYYNNDTGATVTGGFVRLYFQRPNQVGCPDPSVFPGPDYCEAQYWWSTVYFDLSTLLAAGSKGRTLQVSLDPACPPEGGRYNSV